VPVEPAIQPAPLSEFTSTTTPPGFVPDAAWTVKMPDGHVRYFRNKRDADHFAEYGLWLLDRSGLCEYGKTQKIWDEAWVAGLDLSSVPLYELLGDPPEPLWGLKSHDWQLGRVVVFGVFLFASGLGLILGIRPKPLPTKQHAIVRLFG
jgi:hypothetical protein